MTIVSRKVYFVVWATLLVLLFATWGLAQLNLQPLGVVIAMAIAVTKMVLIILYFMHVRYSSRLTWIFAGAGFLWLALFILLTLNDYFTRGNAL